MGDGNDVIVVGAGVLGLATAYNILRTQPETKVLLVERLKGVGRGNTARSAAAYRDMFTSPVNRRLAQGTVAFFEQVQGSMGDIGLRRIGYLWLMTAEQMLGNREALEYLASAGVVFDLMEPDELRRLLPGFEMSDVGKGVLGSRCGILNQNLLSGFYEREVRRLGGEVVLGSEVMGLTRGSDGNVDGVSMAGGEARGGTVVIATGAWMPSLLGKAGIEVPVVTKKRQLFSIRTRQEGHKRLLKAQGFNAHGLMPFIILPGGAYMRPAANMIIAGFADEDRGADMDDRPSAEKGFFLERVRPQLARYFPSLGDAVPEQSWAGHYAYHPPDNVPFVDRVDGAVLVGGASGSGVMKSDAIGRVAAGMVQGRKEVELADGGYIKVSELAMDGEGRPVEGFVI